MKIHVTFLVCLFFLISSGTANAAEVVKKVLRVDPASKPNLVSADRFRPYGEGFTEEDGVFRCENSSATQAKGVSQHVTLNQNAPRPIFASLESRAENVSGSANSNYSLYLDLLYEDGTPEWGKMNAFQTGTHDWQKRTVFFFPEKPVKSLTMYGLFREHSGKVAFRNFELKTLDVDEGVHLFDGNPISVTAAKKMKPHFQLRDFGNKSDFYRLENDVLDFRFSQRAVSENVTEITLKNLSHSDRAITLVYSVPVPQEMRKNMLFCEHPRATISVTENREYCNARSFRIGSSGRLARYPFAAVCSGEKGLAAGFDMGTPSFCRTAYNDATGELYVACDLGFTEENNTVTLRFCSYRFDAREKFRGALQEYYRLFPDAFRCRTPQQGIWMPFSKISQVEGWQDFGFMFKEGNDETAWDDAQGILTFRYTEPMTWWMPLKPDQPRHLQAAFTEAQRLAESGNAAAKGFLQTGMRDRQGNPVAQILDTPWCNGAVWSLNDAPGADGKAGGFSVKWNEKILEQYYGPNRKGDLDGEYIDSSEGYVTAELDFRRENFQLMRTPLTFSQPEAGFWESDELTAEQFSRLGPQVAVFRGLVAFEYIHGIAEDLRKIEKLLMANSTPDHLCWLAPLCDVLGTETNWNHAGNWSPMSDAEMLYRRALCGPKPFCFLMNTEFDKFPHEYTERYMKRALAYGMFPGFFSHNASESTYFSQPELYNRDRDLFKKYVPIIKTIAEAGWQPTVLAECDEEKVYLERFGEKYWTVFNDSNETKTVQIRFFPEAFGPAVPEETQAEELLSQTKLSLRNGSVTLRLNAEDVAVLRLP